MKKADRPKSRRTFYVTTAIPYVNAQPHIGFALELVQADVLARHHRMLGHDVRFLTGTDENSLKNVRAAELEGIRTEALVDRNARAFAGLWDDLNLSFDDFIRTSSDKRHRKGAEVFWQACASNGDIYRRRYRGLYCVGCEQFYKADELDDGRCREHGTVAESVEEENYFFRLSRYRDVLRELITSGTLRIEPVSRCNEILRWIDGGLDDISISRSRERAHGWGIPVPGDSTQIMYVWFDALGNYVTALDYGTGGELFDRYWVNGSERVHVIGKGITRFHAVYWPAMLLSAGLPLPDRILVHGYVTVDGMKIGKSAGNAVDPSPIARAHGGDALRYFLLRHVRTTEDGDFTHQRFRLAHNADLADQLGNLARRILGMIDRYFDGVVPGPARRKSEASGLVVYAGLLPGSVGDCIDRYALHEALAAIWELVATANRYVADSEPWALARRRDRTADPADAKAAGEQLKICLRDLADTLETIARCCWPFLPQSCERLLQQLGTGIAEKQTSTAGLAISIGEILFPKIDR